MDEKTQRYMHRIDQIMLTPTKINSQPRPSRSPLNAPQNSLDKYIKYELSTKIIQEIINKNHMKLANAFFAAIRNTEFRQREKIYKFIGVQKSQKREMRVDIAISGKILLTVLKELAKKRYTEFINSLQEYSKAGPKGLQTTNNKPTFSKKRSLKDSTEYGVLMRTSTIPEKGNYQIVSEWIDDSSALEQKRNLRSQELQKLKKIAVKTLAKVVQIKVQGVLLCGMCKIQVFTCQNEKLNDFPQQKVLQRQQKMKQRHTIIRKIQSAYLFTKFAHKFISSILTAIKRHQRTRVIIESQTAILYEVVNNVYCKQRFRHYHMFFSLITVNNNLSQSQKNQLDAKNRSLMKQSGSSKQSNQSKKSHQISREESQVNYFNPLAKLNFYPFVDRIFKFIIVISKLLIPVREAFIKIDQYASFAYRLEESLKVAPHRYLLESFKQIKDSNKYRKDHQADLNKKAQQSERVYDCLTTAIVQRLIDGFTHIKITAEIRKTKKNPSCVKDSIIKETKKFILDREEHTSQSYENWHQIKSSFISPSNKFKGLEIQI